MMKPIVIMATLLLSTPAVADGLAAALDTRPAS